MVAQRGTRSVDARSRRASRCGGRPSRACAARGPALRAALAASSRLVVHERWYFARRLAMAIGAGVRAAGAAVLDEDHDRDLGRLRRREAREPGVVAVVVPALLGSAPRCERATTCAVPVLPAMSTSSGAPARARNAVPLSSLTHAAAAPGDEREVLRADVELAAHARRKLLHHRAVDDSTARTICGWYSVPPLASAAYASASWSSVTVVAPCPMAAFSAEAELELPPLWQRVVHASVGMRPAGLGVHAEARVRAQAEAAPISRDAGPCPCRTRGEVVEVDVARLGDRLVQIDRAVHVGAAEERLPKVNAPWHCDTCARVDEPFSSAASAENGLNVEPGG